MIRLFLNLRFNWETTISTLGIIPNHQWTLTVPFGIFMESQHLTLEHLRFQAPKPKVKETNRGTVHLQEHIPHSTSEGREYTQGIYK